MNKEQFKVGDIIQSDEGTIACVSKILNGKIRVWINNQKDYILDEQLHHWSYANPIKNNRIVDSYTFAVRFKQFLDWVPKEFYMSGPHILEEYEYMQDIADRLLKYQIQTATDENEIDYLKRLKLWPQ
jgi:hypothetical protein